MKRAVKRLAETAFSVAGPLWWRAQSSPRLLVLMYHRVLPADHPDRRTEQPGMFVAPATLDMHLSVLRQHFELVHLDDWLRRAQAGEQLPARACALTFDDGWLDNYQYAYPVLLEHRAPATIFLVSELVGTLTEFWPNRLARMLATGPLDQSWPKEIAELIAPALAKARARGRFETEEIDEAIRAVKRLDDYTIQSLLDRAQSVGASDASHRAMLNDQELQTMAASGLVRYGSHTRTHFRCRPGAPGDVLQREIGDSGQELRKRVGQPIGLFCYPNGDTSPEATAIVGRHYDGAVTTRKGWYRPGEDRYLIPRVGVHDDITNRRESFLARITGWL